MKYGRILLAGCWATGLLVMGSSCAGTEQLTRTNQVRLERLSLGMPRDKVLAKMDFPAVWMTGDTEGYILTPHRAEVYQAAGAHWEILFYYTTTHLRDGVITDDELTPIVLRDGLLVGIGWPYWDDIADYIICPVQLAKGCPSR